MLKQRIIWSVTSHDASIEVKDAVFSDGGDVERRWVMFVY
jgi:hypothetical protein